MTYTQQIAPRAAALLLLLSLLGCATSARAPAATPTTLPAPVTLTYAFPDDSASRAAAEAVVAGFAAENPTVQIELRPLPAASYAQALAEQQGTHSLPDLFAHSAQQIPALRKSGALLDLVPLGVAPRNLSSAAVEPWQKGDALYGLPQQAVPTMLFYNRTLFAEAGVAPPPEAGWDWPTWRDSARQLSNSTRGQFGTALGGWLGLVWGNGGELFDAERTKTLLDQPAAIDGVQFGADMVHLDKSAPMPPTAGGPDPITLFREGKLAMLPAPSSLIAELQNRPTDFEWDLAPMPTGARRVTVLAVSGIGVSAATAHPDLAARFVAWAGSEAGLAAYLKALPFAVAPLAEGGAARLTASTPGFPGSQLIAEALDYGRVPPFVVQTPQINELVNQALVPVFQGIQPASVAYRQLAPTINTILAAG
jgi:multiple sugar transport system substrate-binding protein